jgi:hypothetical protein
MIGWNINMTMTSRIQFLVEAEIIPYATTLKPTTATAEFPI